MQMDDPVTAIPLVGPRYSQKLTKLGIKTVGDLLYHFPARYQNFGAPRKISELVANEPATIRATVLDIRNIFTKYGKRLTKATVGDGSGQIAVWWFNQTYLIQNIKPGKEYFFSGRLGRFGNYPALIAPEYEKADSDCQLHTASLVPIYPETGGISSKWLRSRIASALKATALEEFLPPAVLREERLVGIQTALKEIHRPRGESELARARRRLEFEELYLSILRGLRKKQFWQERSKAPPIRMDEGKRQKLLGSLPFQLTADQRKATEEILADISRPVAMNRLLQGDVGCGKTIVAGQAILATCLAGLNSAYMAPTQILAEQHRETLAKLFKPFSVEVALIKGGGTTPIKVSKQTRGTVFVGTHALLFKKELPALALAVIDEQHRFGVRQRAKLAKSCHTLTMTATPIPRSLALTLYGDLDISSIEQMPPGRLPVTTWLVPQAKRQSACQWLEKEIKRTGQGAFWICPFIEESVADTLKSVKSAKTEFAQLKKRFPRLRLGLLHGRMGNKEKQRELGKFQRGETDILVTTPVVEVGVDIARAGFIVIEGAERFGLASLHQLRGRVGRNGQKAYCLLFTSRPEFEKSRRLKVLEKERRGLKLARLDLRIRGEGEVFGLAQHGRTGFKIANLSDGRLLNRARRHAKETLARLESYPELAERVGIGEDIARN